MAWPTAVLPQREWAGVKGSPLSTNTIDKNRSCEEGELEPS